ncbi:MAG: cytochrome P450 [Nitratireductor sp.]
MAYVSKYTNKYKLLKEYSQKERENVPDLREKHFDLETAYAQGFFTRIFLAFYNRFNRAVILPLLMLTGWKLRWPFTWVVRYDTVVKILSAPEVFNVPFGTEMTDMGAGTNFALGDDGELHARQRKIMMELFSDPAIVENVIKATRFAGEALLEDSGGQVNAVRDFITRATTHACLDTYGMVVDNADDFAEYSMSGSALLFADPFGDPKYRRQALIGAKRLREIIRGNVRRISVDLDAGRNVGNGMLAKLVAKAKADPESIGGVGADFQKAVQEITAMMLGMTTGFVPTNALGAEHVLEELSRWPKQFENARNLAQKVREEGEGSAEARAELHDLLLEAARLNPALFPGQFRHANGENDGEGLLAKLGFEDDETIMVSTGMALRDPRKFPSPGSFRPGRFRGEKAPYNLLFGHGLHACIGQFVAMEVITELFATLFSRKDIRFASDRPKMKRVGPIPWQLDMVFEPETGDARRVMITSAIPLKPDADEPALRRLLQDWMREDALKSKIDTCGIVHFMSLNVVDLGEEGSPRWTLLVEINADGTAAGVISRIMAECGEQLELLEPWLAYKPMQGNKKQDPSSGIAGRIIDHMVTFQTYPFGAIGLNFDGSGEFSANQLEKEQALYNWVRDNVISSANRNMTTGHDSLLGAARAIINDPASNAGDLRKLLIRPSARRPEFSRRPSSDFNTFLLRFFTGAPFSTAAVALLVLTIIVPAVLLACGKWAKVLPAYVDTWMVPLLLLLTGIIGFVVVLRRHETVLDKPDDRFASPDHMRKILAGEDLAGYAQNHLTSVSQMKPGNFRLITMALAMFIIKRMAQIWFKKGFVTDFSTIHYAKWFRLPGTRKLIFQTNYDGSWESYLEDFVTMVHGGQTMAWNNGVGFPRTNWFYLDGAQDGDQFKRWVRRQQVENLFWYSRFPQLTLAQKQINALVRDGLARARSASEKAGWEALFGSTQKAATTMETNQVQTLLFGGLGKHECGELIAVAFDQAGRKRAGEWISQLSRNWFSAETANPFGEVKAPGIAFGDAYPDAPVRFVAFSAAGLEHLGVEGNTEGTGLSTFPAAFYMGMATRAAILGDDVPGAAGASQWQWRDAGENDDSNICHAVLLHYARNDKELGELSNQLEYEVRQFGLRIVRRIAMPTIAGAKHKEPFGFRDGISQPVMSGTRNSRASSTARDNVVGPGEFIFGYRDTRGYIPPSPQVSVSAAGADILPMPPEAIPGDDPQFDHPQAGDMRDIGRNGSFLVVRQLAQDKDAFSRFCEEAAKNAPGAPTGKGRNAQYWHIAETERVKSKMFGRWPDGSSLTAWPVMSASRHNRLKLHDLVAERLAATASKKTAKGLPFERDGVVWDEKQWQRFLAFIQEPENAARIGDIPGELLRDPVPELELHHGSDDPQGQFCPLGSHIRRSNPRDSLRPGNPVQTEINNRHRLLRRGRRYADNGEEGTLFMCFNTNIERQFEFIQQTWVNSRAFHGMRNAPDPIVAAKVEGDVFTIQGASGNREIALDGKDGTNDPMANFVTMRGGGYFFMPGRLTLEWLARLSQDG